MKRSGQDAYRQDRQPERYGEKQKCKHRGRERARTKNKKGLDKYRDTTDKTKQTRTGKMRRTENAENISQREQN